MKKTFKLCALVIFTIIFFVNFQPVIAATDTIDTTSPSALDPTLQKESDGSISINFGKAINQNKNWKESWINFLSRYKNFIVGVSGIATISMLLFFVAQFMKLGAVASNPSKRLDVLSGLLWTGIATAGLGSVTIIVGFFFNSLN